MNESTSTGETRWGYALLLRLHFYAGLLVGPFIFVAALSGALFALTPQIENWLYHTELAAEATGEAQPLANQIVAARDHIGENATTYDDVLERARAAGIDAGLLEIKPAADATRAWVVREIDRSWPTQVDMVAIDPHSMTVTDRVDFETFPMAAKLTRWGIDAHMGILFGLPNQLFVAACALALCVIIVLGYRMWWLRRPTQAGQNRPTARRVWTQLTKAPPLALVVMAGTAIGLGLFAPVMGVSLMAFLLVDAALAVGRRAPEKRLDLSNS